MLAKKDLSPLLIPVYEQLKQEGYDIYTFDSKYYPRKAITSVYWYENGRILDIQRGEFSAYKLYTAYIPTEINGSGCKLAVNSDPLNLLQYRNIPLPDWIRGVRNYKSGPHFISKQVVLEWFEIKE